MKRTELPSVISLVVLYWLLCAPPAWAVMLGSGSNGNTTAASLDTYTTNNGDPSLPYFANVGKGSADGTVFYLGNRWILSAAHVNVDNNVGPVRFGATSVGIDNSSTVILHNADNSLADLKLVRLTADPGIAPFPLSLINSASPSSRVVMIGNGLDEGTQHFWTVDKSQATWQWNETPSQPLVPGLNDYSGFNLLDSHTIRWGENRVLNTGVVAQTSDDGQGHPEITHGFTVKFDNLSYTLTIPLANEAHAAAGDSGGPVFSLVSGSWRLSGIMISTSAPLNNQPANTELFNDQTLSSDLSLYRTQILAIVPEPATLTLAAMAAVMVLLFCGKKTI